ncbi:MAG: hypothetical protein LQ340_000771 [Diploschistes diacapsis]|nr:MAG: hypothetical protein LQ340_000771 [Diploschistes diacapsis]
MRFFFTLFTAAGTLSLAAAQYGLVEDFFSGNFFDHFTFYTGADPTAGWVNYVDRATAQNDGLINTNKGAFIGVDSTTNNVAAPGRNSVRLSSNNAYTHMLLTLQLYNMPGGIPGTWPAFWTFGPDWPSNGEIDIVEGVNGANSNSMTIHTGSSCTLNGGGNGLLQPFLSDCNANDNSNAGCSFHDPDPKSYGTGFNSVGGGVFAMEWTADGVSIWRWPQGSQPGDVFGDGPNPSGWGAPSANWASSDANCDFETSLSRHNIIFDTTFCGSWAGAVYDGGLDACQTFVSNNPAAFANAYWGVSNLRVYQQQSSSTNSGQGAKPSASSASAMAKASPSATPIPSSPSKASSSSSTMSASPVVSSSSVALPSTVAISTSFSTVASTSSIVSTPTPAQPKAKAIPTIDPLASNDFGSGSGGIPAGSEGWKRAADMRMGERRRRHLARHLRSAKA